MEEVEEELQRLKWLILAVILFLAFGLASIREFRFAIWGRVTGATVDRVNTSVDKSDLTVYYHFADLNGKERSEQDTVDSDWDIPKQGSIEIQYIPGSKSSRLHGHDRFLLVYLFLISLAALVGAVYKLSRMAHQPIRRTSGRRGR